MIIAAVISLILLTSYQQNKLSLHQGSTGSQFCTDILGWEWWKSSWCANKSISGWKESLFIKANSMVKRSYIYEGQVARNEQSALVATCRDWEIYVVVTRYLYQGHGTHIYRNLAIRMNWQKVAHNSNLLIERILAPRWYKSWGNEAYGQMRLAVVSLYSLSLWVQRTISEKFVDFLVHYKYQPPDTTREYSPNTQMDSYGTTTRTLVPTTAMMRWHYRTPY
jgi:hypothetical protein